jgi:hypothetical protein
MKTTFALFAILGLAATAGAQTVPVEQVVTHAQVQNVIADKQMQLELQKAATSPMHVTFQAHPVTGAPYSADAVTDSVQVLADGNRIVTHSAVRVYRDSKGRTRRETLGADGQVTSITISDPASGRSYTINPRTNTVQGSGVATYSVSRSATSSTGSGGADAITVYTASADKKLDELKAAQAAQQAPHVAVGGAGGAGVGQYSFVVGNPMEAGKATKEALGQQSFDGVQATGVRTTTVLPAGAIGNDQPITIVTEEWTADDLKVLVMTKHTDPRSGETTYRLSGINRAEPNPSLFELPAGTTVK